MPSIDRHWRATLLASLLCAAAVVLAPFWVLSQMLPPTEELGESIVTDLLLAAAWAMAVLLLTIVLAVAAVRGCYRTHRRRAALDGDQDAIPQARLTANPARAPDVATEPLVLRWRATLMTRLVLAPLGLLLALLLAMTDGIYLLTLVLLFSGHALPGFVTSWFLSLPIAIVLSVWLVRSLPMLPALLGRPFGITASTMGVEYRMLSGGYGVLHWEEMRLLEMSTQVSTATVGSPPYLRLVLVFWLHGAHTTIEWRDSPINWFVPDGMTPEEAARRALALIHLVNAHTGLVPRTFERSLHAAGQSDSVASSAVISAALAAFILASAAAVLVLPLTTSGALNAMIAVSLGALTLLIMLVTGRQLAAAHSRGELTGTREPAATLVPPPLSSGAVYALSFALQWRWRLALAVLGTLLLVNAVPVLLVVAPDSVRSLAPNGLLPQVSGALGSALAFLLMLYGLTGLALLLVAQDYASSTVRADAVGVTRRIGKASTSLAWDDIERVSASSRRGRMSAYSVTGNLGRTIISWPAQSSALRALMPAPDAMLVTPEELAALVASRSGKALEHV